MQRLLPRLGGVTPCGLAFLAVFALLVPLASGAMAQTPTALLPLDGDTDSKARAINNRGEVAGELFVFIIPAFPVHVFGNQIIAILIKHFISDANLVTEVLDNAQYTITGLRER